MVLEQLSDYLRHGGFAPSGCYLSPQERFHSACHGIRVIGVGQGGAVIECPIVGFESNRYGLVRPCTVFICILFLFISALFMAGCSDTPVSTDKEKARIRVQAFVVSNKEQVYLTEIYSDKRWTLACLLGPYEMLGEEVGAGFNAQDKLPWLLHDSSWGIAFFDDKKRLVFDFPVSRQFIDVGRSDVKCVARNGAALRITKKHEIELVF